MPAIKKHYRLVKVRFSLPSSLLLLIRYIDAENWRCPSCVSNKLEPEPKEEAPQDGSLAAIARDLLPVHKDSLGPDSHSIFNSLIVEEDPMDGSRHLRKRRSPDESNLSPDSKRQKRLPSSSDGSPAPVFGKKSGGGSADKRDGDQQPLHRTRDSGRLLCRVVSTSDDSLIMALRVDKTRLRRILKSRPRARAPKRNNQRVSRAPEFPPPPTIPINPSPYVAPFYTFHERENDDLKSKPYGGILSESDADTSKTLPLTADRESFEAARQKADEEWKQKMALEDVSANNPANRKISGPPSKIRCINFAGYEIETWYAAPYPEEYSRNRVLFICEFCLKYMNSGFVAWRHKLKCPVKHPPGDEIYRDGSISIFEVDGRKNPVYCQNLCLLAKLFLGSKTLYYDVEPFLFYIMTEYDEYGFHFVGYFSKEKRPSSANNVSCILTLPIHQRKGYGNLLIDFSYLLTRVERRTGSPEKPLSDMGLISYRNYWRLVLAYQLRDQKQQVSISELSERTGMTPDDIVSGLEGLHALVRDPVTKTYALRIDYSYLEEYIRKWESKNYIQLNPSALVWTPYIMGRKPPPCDHSSIQAANDTVVDTLGISISESGFGTANGDALINGDTHRLSPYIPPALSVSSFDASSRNNMGVVTPSISSAATTQNAQPNPAAGIPPTRFEIFPPPAGSSRRVRSGQFGGTRPNRTFNRRAVTQPTRSSGRTTPKAGGARAPGKTETSRTKGKAHGKVPAKAQATPHGRRTRSSRLLEPVEPAVENSPVDEDRESSSAKEVVEAPPLDAMGVEDPTLNPDNLQMQQTKSQADDMPHAGLDTTPTDGQVPEQEQEREQEQEPASSLAQPKIDLQTDEDTDADGEPDAEGEPDFEYQFMDTAQDYFVKNNPTLGPGDVGGAEASGMDTDHNSDQNPVPNGVVAG